jgi:hypothetical protein
MNKNIRNAAGIFVTALAFLSACSQVSNGSEREPIPTQDPQIEGAAVAACGAAIAAITDPNGDAKIIFTPEQMIQANNICIKNLTDGEYDYGAGWPKEKDTQSVGTHIVGDMENGLGKDVFGFDGWKVASELAEQIKEQGARMELQRLATPTPQSSRLKLEKHAFIPSRAQMRMNFPNNPGSPRRG